MELAASAPRGQTAMTSRTSATQILVEIAADRLPARDGLARLYPVVYDELRRLAGALMRDQKPGHTLQATALVHEAYLRLVDQTQIHSKSRGQFFCVAAKAMRSVLVDHARRRGAKKRGGGWHRITLDGQVGTRRDPRQEIDLEVLGLHEALDRLAEKDERLSQVVEMRVFAGLTVAEVADVLGVSKRTIDNDWLVARAWLSDQMSRDDAR
jgi:RNA polymerase sigma factor (TIGR02999 family)